MNKQFVSFFLTCTFYLLLNCGSSSKSARKPKQDSLADLFKNDFTIGAALNSNQITETNPEVSALIVQQFNTLTPENVMKAAIIHPEWDRYDFGMADKLISFAKKYKKQVNGHTLIWHSQLPGFVSRITNADSIRQFMSQHISTVAGRYNKQLDSWDVVNEALNEDGSMRNSVFFRTLGESYLLDAFRLAAKASPDSKLYYNDYNIEQPKKRAGAIALIRKIQSAGLRVDGVGIQGHWHVGRVPFKEIEESIQQFAALGIEIAFTELDIDVLPRNFQGAEVSRRMEADANSNPYAAGLPDSIQNQLAQDYADLFQLFLKYRKDISRITFWGVHDGESWLNNWPIRGRKNHPLLFDRNLHAKPAFQKLIALKK